MTNEEYMVILARYLKDAIMDPVSAYEDYVYAKNKKNELDRVGAYLVKRYGPGQGADIDNYYHALLQCELAQRGQPHLNNGLAMGYLKEHLYDRWKKSNSFGGKMSEDDFNKDVQKDLTNNENGSIIGDISMGLNCKELLDYLRTPRMRDAGIY